MTHDQLVTVAAQWLQKKHAIVITELATIGEEPDAIGWRGTFSTLVECKASREDFRADKQKHFRQFPESGIGNFRYYMTPPGLVSQDELPKGWGLLEVTGSKVRKVRESEQFYEVNSRHEIGLLLSTLRRIGKDAPMGVSIRCYTIDTKNRAALYVEEPEACEVAA